MNQIPNIVEWDGSNLEPTTAKLYDLTVSNNPYCISLQVWVLIYDKADKFVLQLYIPSTDDRSLASVGGIGDGVLIAATCADVVVGVQMQSYALAMELVPFVFTYGKEVK